MRSKGQTAPCHTEDPGWEAQTWGRSLSGRASVKLVWVHSDSGWVHHTASAEVSGETKKLWSCAWTVPAAVTKIGNRRTHLSQIMASLAALKPSILDSHPPCFRMLPLIKGLNFPPKLPGELEWPWGLLKAVRPWAGEWGFFCNLVCIYRHCSCLLPAQKCKPSRET